jgi:hypothetical protein
MPTIPTTIELGDSILGALQGDASGYLLNEFTPDLKRIFQPHAPKTLLHLSDRLPGSKHAQPD